MKSQETKLEPAGGPPDPAFRPAEPRPGRLFWLCMAGSLLAVSLLAYLQYTRAERAGRGRSAGAITDIPIFGEVPEFALTERGGETITRDGLRGKVWIADFIFTTCGGPCPIMSRRMAGLQAELDRLRWSDVKLVSISVDPTRDTPAVLADYANAYGASPRRWLFLTGPKQQVFDLCIKGFKLALEDATPDNTIIHSTKFALVDRKGRIRGYFDVADDDPDVQAMMELPPSGKKGDVDARLLRAAEALLQEKDP